MFIRNIGLKGLCFCFWGEEVFSLSGLEIKVLLVTEWVCKDSLRLSRRKGWIVWEKLVTIFPVVSVTLFWKEQFVSEPLLLLPSLFFVLLLYFSPKSQVVLRMEEVKLALTANTLWEHVGKRKKHWQDANEQLLRHVNCLSSVHCARGAHTGVRPKGEGTVSQGISQEDILGCSPVPSHSWFCQPGINRWTWN